MAEGKAMPFNAKNVVNGSNQRVRKRQKGRIMDTIREDIKYLSAFIFFYIYWQVVLWILVKNLKRKSEHL
jgi:hypothetical protein